jgi:acetyl esterase/lipase
LLALCAAEPRAFAYEVDVSYAVPYVERDSGDLMADVYVPRGNGPFPGVIVVHGGAWRMGNRAQLAGVAQMIAAKGMTAVAISYRLAPQDKFPAQIDDCKEAVRWMRANASKWKIDPEHIGGFGYSAGAHLVALLGTTSPEDGLEGVPDWHGLPSTRLQAVAAGGTPCDFRLIPKDVDGLSFWLGGTPAQKPEAYRLASPAAFVTHDDPPFFFFHGEDDQLVPILSPRVMRAQLLAVGVPAEMDAVPNVGHLGCAVNMDACEKAIAFLEQHLKTGAK